MNTTGLIVGYVIGVGSCVVAVLVGERLSREDVMPTPDEMRARLDELDRQRAYLEALVTEADALEAANAGPGSVAYPHPPRR